MWFQSLALGALVIRWLHYISFQPRLSILFGTLVLALPDLLHFTVVLMTCLVMFAAASSITFGPSVGRLYEMGSALVWVLQYALLREDSGTFRVRGWLWLAVAVGFKTGTSHPSRKGEERLR